MAIFRRISNLFSRKKIEREIHQELAAHIQMRIEDNLAGGMSAREARRDALVRFGNPMALKERVMMADAALALEQVWMDLRYALRQLRRSPAFTVAVVLTVALGIGVNTAMFSVIRGVLLRPLPYRDAGRLVVLSDGATPIRFEAMLAGARSYQGLGAYAGGSESMALSGDGAPEVLKGARVSGNFLDILGVQPLLGRSFLPFEDKPDAPAVAMISAELWLRRFNAAPSILGRSVTLAGDSYTVIGVLPAGFSFPFAGTDVWVAKPSEWSVIDLPSRRISPTLRIFGRLKTGVDLQHANTELTVLDGQYAAANPTMLDAGHSKARLWTRPPDHVELWRDQLVANIRAKLWMLFGAVVLVLLIVCANIASLLLARATARSREFAVRAAIGAGRGRILAQLLTESVMLSLAGGTLGVGLAEFCVRGIPSMKALDLPRSGEIRIDGAVLAFAAVVALLAGVLFGLLPALTASRPDLSAVLRGSGESARIGRYRSIFKVAPRSLLVVAQVGLSLILLIGATLLIKSLGNAYRVDPGFQASGLLTMSIAPSPARYGTVPRRAAFYQAILDEVESLPGVSSAAIARSLPMSGFAGVPVAVVGRPLPKLNERPIAVYEEITPQYFQTMGIALKHGRTFTAHDNAGATPVALIDEGMARHFWPDYPNGVDPVGQRVLIGAHSPPAEIVGIAADIHQAGLDSEPRVSVYRAVVQSPPESAMLAVKTMGNPSLLANAVRARILAVDPAQPVSDVASMSEVVDASEGPLRAMMTLLGIFAALATLIAMVGLYGVIAYSVAQRTPEMGIRRALGAQRGSILSLVVGQGMRLALAGVVLGLCGAFALTRVLHGMLFQTSATDPLTYVATACLFLFIAGVAAWFPALRAASVDPMRALRNE